MAKRLDLQALRGLFICEVLFFHFFPSIFPNGYVGVDQFFVLSGYLISMVLNREFKGYMLLFYNFYYSRIKRIFPLYVFFILIGLISLFFVFPPNNIDLNLESAIPALFFYTNEVGTNPEKEYSSMLAVAEDIFTHTWSLSVEIQFYFIVPFIYCTERILNDRFKPAILLIISSLGLHLILPPALAFNSVFARIWQFLSGYIIFVWESNSLKQKNAGDSAEALLPVADKKAEAFHHPSKPPRRKYDYVLLLTLLTTLGLNPFEFDATSLRVVITTLTALAIYANDTFLTTRPFFRPFVYLGDISYVLYLVHWPVYVYFHLYDLTTQYHMTMGILISIIISIIIHEKFEKKYLTFGKPVIMNMLLGLYLLNILLVNQGMVIKTKLYPEKEELEVVPANISLPDAMKLNEEYQRRDYYNIFHPNCTYDGTGPFGRCVLPGSPRKKEIALVIGNSYAPNNIFPYYEYCRLKVNRTILFSRPACEVLFDTTLDGYKCEKHPERFIDETEKWNPDILLIMTRHLTIMPKKEMTEQEEKEAQEKVDDYVARHAAHVKRKLLILQALPRPKGSISRLVNNALRNSTGSRNVIPQRELEDVANWKLANERLAKAAEKCPNKKCQLIEYIDNFKDADGNFQFYDPKTGVTYFNSARHLTKHGLNHVRPVYKELCKNL